MLLTELTTSWEGGAATVRARFAPDGADSPRHLWYRIQGCRTPPQGLADALAVGFLTPAMYESSPLEIEGGLSAALQDNLARAQKILSGWYSYLSPVAVCAPSLVPQADSRPQPGAVACCFTGGVDSWYSLLKHSRRVTHLLLIRGFDIGLENDALWRTTCARIGAVAERMGKQLITCETNLRLLTDKRRAGWGRRHDGDFWGECLHGAALASVALTLQDEFSELIVPATHTESQIRPWGSSPALDTLWSTERLRITHDGCEADRVEKTRAICDSDLALATLRVCHDDTAAYNCGRCEKCLRTMMTLRLCGALPRARTFPQTLSMARVRRMAVPRHVRHRYDELIAAAADAHDKPLVRALEAATGRRFSLQHEVAAMRRKLRYTVAGDAWRMLRRRRAHKRR